MLHYQTETFRIWCYGLISFGKSFNGHLISFVVNFIRAVITLSSVTLSLLCVILLKRHLAKKMKLHAKILAGNKAESTNNLTRSQLSGTLLKSLQDASLKASLNHQNNLT
jgi:hypothetical protein